MKKIFSAFMIAVCCMLMAMPVQAQLLKWCEYDENRLGWRI